MRQKLLDFFVGSHINKENGLHTTGLFTPLLCYEFFRAIFGKKERALVFIFVGNVSQYMVIR
mgnify:CR=1